MEFSSFKSVSEFFHEAVSAAMRNQGVDGSEMTEFYLVNLLSDYAKAPIDDAPLAIRLNAAANALPEERARALREIGDQSLYVSGFFAESLQRSLVDVGYYINMGGTAYSQLARMNACGRQFGQVYSELAGKFGQFVEVLAEVSKGSAINTDRGVVQLYERWLRTGSDWAERKLRARGMLPKKGDIQ
ncbi:MAG: hypothetical protein EXR72_17210 [Myxococcales bacterium]|nr:hypothetical protein [Myxococcales bacterium]